MNNEAARQIFWADNNTLPYIDFNTNGVKNKSTYFKTGYKPNVLTTVEICFGFLPVCALDTGHQNGCRTGWVENAFQINIGFGLTGRNHFWPAWNSVQSFSHYIDQRDYQFPKLMTVKQAAGGKYYFNDQLMKDFNQNYNGINYEYFIGDVNENGNPKASTDSQGSARWHWTKIYENDVLLHHFVPFVTTSTIKLRDILTNAIIEQSKCNGGTEIAYGELKPGN